MASSLRPCHPPFSYVQGHKGWSGCVVELLFSSSPSVQLRLSSSFPQSSEKPLYMLVLEKNLRTSSLSISSTSFSIYTVLLFFSLRSFSCLTPPGHPVDFGLLLCHSNLVLHSFPRLVSYLGGGSIIAQPSPCLPASPSWPGPSFPCPPHSAHLRHVT